MLKAINVVKDWIENDTNILVMSGEFGCGKTHLLRIANTYFKPLSLAITAQKLARLFYDGIDDKSLSRNLEILESSPVLLIDDFGDFKGNTTRFLILSKESNNPKYEKNNSYIFSNRIICTG